MIPSNIEASHILLAIEKIDNEGYDPRREATDYNLYFNGNKYPPKVIISYANFFANSEELPTSSFGGGSEANSFLIEKGFPILQNENKNPDRFFTVEELQFFDRYANQPYDHNDPVSGNAGDFIANYFWARSKTWADGVTQQLTDFNRKGRKSWNERRNNQTGQVFKPYTWYQLRHSQHYHENVFYTVGVGRPSIDGNSSSRLLIKLDCYRAKMTREQSDAFDNFLEAKGVKWQLIEEPLNDLNWQRLIDLSIQYIDSTFQTYLAAIELVEGGVLEMAARITWNSLGWVKPSGRAGKSVSTADTHEKQFGYTPEEWLFDFEKTIDGFHYARLEALNADHHIGKTYNLTLFAHEFTEKGWFWIARIVNAKVIDPELSANASAEYRRKKWLEEQYQQLDAIDGVGSEKYKQLEDTERFNVRFRPEDVTLYDYEPFGRGEQPPSNHYNLPALKGPPAFQTTPNDSGSETIEYGSETEAAPTGEIKRTYSPRMIELENVHRKVQTGYARFLRERKLPGHKIYTESYKTRDRTRIDILEVTSDARRIFYEVKTYPNCRYSIRMAIGQLLEYAYFPEECLADEFVIVSHLVAGQTELDYLDHLSRELVINISYVCYDHINHQVLTDANN